MAEAPTSVSSEDPAVFPALSTSEYRVETATVGVRYWFSGGATLNQQQTADAVGFVWTHWLADRGIQVAGTNFDEAYAHELQRECQRLSGIPESPESGGFAWAAARVLQARGLVETCFTCPDLPAIQNALLERGPIILGLVWQQSMFEPQLIDGRYVCRVDQDVSARGGHAVLLNGISLDLRLGGITGFARFKNSWGPDWGENGQCLISLDDLEKLLNQDGEALLPIPVATALRRKSSSSRCFRVRPIALRPNRQPPQRRVYRQRAARCGRYCECPARSGRHPRRRARRRSAGWSSANCRPTIRRYRQSSPTARGCSTRTLGRSSLAVLATRWPSLISVLAQPASPAGRQSILQLLEEATPDLAQQLAGTGLGERVVQQLLATDLSGFLAAEPKVGGHAAAYL